MDEWRAFKSVLRTCLSYNGMVFGGAVRDMMLHNINSKRFLDMYNYSDYSDITVNPETIDRLVIPNDIDCLIQEDDYRELIEHLTKRHFIRIVKTKTLYFTENQKYNHVKVVVLFDRKHNIYVKLDLIVQVTSGELIFPYMNLDFDVNGLTLTSNGIGLNKNMTDKSDTIENTSRLQVIIVNIGEKKAFTLEKCQPYRYEKMIKYGWCITYVSTIFQYYHEESYDGNCIICKDTIKDCSVKYKLCKCDLRICLTCMLEYYKKLNKCPLCKKICYEQSDAIWDLHILKCRYP